MLYDADIREPLFDFLEETYGKIRIIEEKTMGKSRADVVMVAEDSLYGIEIKSDADSYSRLALQVKDYDKYYDYNYVVVGTSHAAHIREHIPAYWGVITVEEVDGQADFYVLKKPEVNPKMKLKCKLKIMWRPELAAIQEMNGMPKYKQAGKDTVIEKIIERTQYPENKKGYIALEKLARQISDILFERDYNAVSETLNDYYKGELQKKIEAENDPEKQIELMIEQAEKRKMFRKTVPVKRKRRRK